MDIQDNNPTASDVDDGDYGDVDDDDGANIKTSMKDKNQGFTKAPTKVFSSGRRLCGRDIHTKYKTQNVMILIENDSYYQHLPNSK